MAFFLTLFMTVYLRLENRRRDGVIVGRSIDEDVVEEADEADNATWFRYTV